MRILHCTFDPVTQKELEYCLQYRKVNGIKDVFIRVDQDGVLPYQKRLKLVERCIRPYRHIHLYTGNICGEEIPVSLKNEEEQARNGCFYLCARGSKTLIHQNGYYYENIAKALCKPRRYEHSVSVAKTAYQLAKMHHLDAESAYRMGLLHDITKKWDDEKGKELLAIYYPKGLQYDPKVWHSFTAPFFIQKYLCLHDHQTLNAIWHHTLGDGKSDYDAILYIADKIEPLRGYDASKEWEVSRISLQKGARYVLQKAKAYILKTEGKNV